MISPRIGNPADMIRRDADRFAVMARARETAAERPLIIDPFAALFTAAADGGADLAPGCRRAVTDFVAARTKWFDEFFLTAGSAGVTQVVLLAPGSDTRAWRLPWLSDTVIYEVDDPDDLHDKGSVLATAGAQPAAKYVPVPADLSGDWPRELTAAGFDHGEPTAWAAEGLLPTLSPDAAQHLFDRIALYSARGSRVAVDAVRSFDAAGWLCDRCWETTGIDAAELLHRYHRDPVVDDVALAETVFVSARLL